jgi:hypothetical protein
MADEFDPYREALVVETNTIWPDEFRDLPAAEKDRLHPLLHASAKDCKQVEYVRLHTGFCRTITATAEDLQRVRPK